MKKVVILGGGSAGVMFANRMRKEFSEDAVQMTVIEKSETHIYQPAFTLVVFELDQPENLTKPMKNLFFEGINLITDEATKIEPKENRVMTSKSGEISYDYLVIATGARLIYDEPEGMLKGLEKGENVFMFYCLDGAIRLREAVKRFEGGTIVSSICQMPIKCPAAPVKFIMLAENTMRRRGIRDKCRFVFTTPMSDVFSRQPYAAKLNSIFKERGIEAIANFTPSEVDYEKGVIKSFTKGQEPVQFDLLCITPPHEGQPLIENSEGVGNAAGWVTCDKNLMVHTTFPNIYGIGDATDFPTSKTASGVRKQAKVLTERMKSLIKGEKPTATYDGEVICPMPTRYGKALFAEFNYTESISPAIESYFNWMVKVHMLRPLYWNLMLNGLM
ncbi:MAG: FAD/NAD(P)-binding oxidoreductase [bacterium]